MTGTEAAKRTRRAIALVFVLAGALIGLVILLSPTRAPEIPASNPSGSPSTQAAIAPTAVVNGSSPAVAASAPAGGGKPQTLSDAERKAWFAQMQEIQGMVMEKTKTRLTPSLSPVEPI